VEVAIYELMLYGLLVGVIAGAIGGTLAGIAGVGGGLIYVPLFYLAMPGDTENVSAQVILSLAAVAMTGFFSARAHWRLGHLNRPAFRALMPGLLIGAALGLWSTLQIPEAAILLSLALLDAWIAWDYGRETEQSRAVPLTPLSAPIGYISGLLGIGGGTMLVPLLRRSVALREAVGTSAMCGMVMALGAVVANLLFESQWQPLLKEQLPFIIGTLAGILLIIPYTAKWSADLHRDLPEQLVRTILKALFALLALLLAIAGVMAL